MIKQYRDYTKPKYKYYSVCEDCGKKISAGSKFCEKCFQKGERNSRYKGGYKRKDGYIMLSFLIYFFLWENFG